MARPIRVDFAGGWYHVTARGNERRPIYRADADRVHFLERLAQLPPRFGVRMHAHVLMTNHYHLLVETPKANLSQAIHWLNVSYSVWFNRRHRRVGHLFQGRFKAIVVEPEEWALRLSRYVHLNPVRVRRLGLDKQERRRQQEGLGERTGVELVKERIARLRTYRWSSYRAYTGLEKPPGWLTTDTVLGWMGSGSRRKRQRAYRRGVEEEVRDGREESPWEELEAGVAIGTEQFVEQVRERLQGSGREQPGWRALARGGVRFGDIVAAVEKVKGEKWGAFRDRYGDWGRDLVLYVARQRSGMTLQALGEAVGGIDYGTVAAAVDRFGKRVGKEKNLTVMVKQVMDQM